MVKEDLGWELEAGDELIIFEKDSHRKVAEGEFHSIGCGVCVHNKKGVYYNGSFITHFNIKYKDGYKDGGIHMFSLSKYKFKLKDKLNSILKI
jgi:hypothetical protein